MFQNNEDRDVVLNFPPIHESEIEDSVEVDDEFDHIDIPIAESDLNVSQWQEGLTVHPHSLGGVSGGKVIVYLVESTDGYIIIRRSRQDMMVAGGQIYTPVFKQLFRKNMVSANKKAFGSIPALVQQQLCDSDFLCSTSEASRRELSRLMKVLDSLLCHGHGVIDTANGSNAARIEIYFQSDLSKHCTSIKFPSFNIFDFLCISVNSACLSNCQDVIEEVTKPLRKVFVEQEGKDLSVFCAETKGMLVLLAELAITMLEVRTFSGKATQEVTKRLDENHGILWYVPPDYLHEIPERDEQYSGLNVGLDKRILSVPIHANDESLRLGDQFSNTLPPYCQMFQDHANFKGLISPCQFLKSVGLFMGAIYNALHMNEFGGEPEEQRPEPPPRSFFEAPSASEVAKISPEIAKILVKSTTRILARLYDIETYMVVKEASLKQSNRRNHGRRAEDRLNHPAFPDCSKWPTTVQTLHQHLQSRDVQIDISNLDSGRITNVGKCLKLLFPSFNLFLIILQMTCVGTCLFALTKVLQLTNAGQNHPQELLSVSLPGFSKKYAVLSLMIIRKPSLIVNHVISQKATSNRHWEPR